VIAVRVDLSTPVVGDSTLRVTAPQVAVDKAPFGEGDVGRARCLPGLGAEAEAAPAECSAEPKLELTHLRLRRRQSHAVNEYLVGQGDRLNKIVLLRYPAPEMHSR
jgi:hypothetical protein